MRRLALLPALLFTGLLLTGCRAERPQPPALLLISLDGFRYDYLERYDAPTLRRLAREGVHAADGMQVAFPTKTFPNHYTTVTGLYPEHHGIVANNMYDPAMDAWFSLSNREAVEDARWWGGEPLWVTAEKQGLRSATYFWPGSEAAIRGVRPTYWKRYDSRVPGPERVDTVLAWLDLPAGRRPAFITLYFSDVDGAGHRYGPDAPETAEAVARVDGYLARLVAGLEARDLYDRVNLIVLSDHGMTATGPERVIALDDYIDPDDLTIVDRDPVLMARPKAGRFEAVYAALKDAHPHLHVYRREETPARWHFRAHPRIPDLIAVADEGWRIVTERARAEADPDRLRGGSHGYDNALPSMHALFVAHGPAFRQGLTVAPFENVHLYALMAHVLGLRPAPNDGTLDAVRHLLRDTG
ncbi:ectonucleotide pyrophosphatase/phosphodiesterase [Rhodocaloribacter litoris]|uniref:alkaline phosphatase family protein n=1 Tax=Rhodocaloribacter litoris TaxID=2558931 RepID=UPI0014216260|nr:ectonucleotide pyrophosphatase/phosphodiesterase [Rhodocaloribacter litoris]QXD16548.1 ectonucleotide pyrophosphatase/phosphodiesterase [Rhodocaloribacter litoris]